MPKNPLKTIELSGLPKKVPLVVGCSGGADSMALTLLLAEYCKRSGNTLTAITVDHGLRKESAVEAAQVGKWLKKHSIEHVVLKWEGKKPASNIQEAAREARYQLLAEYCHAHNVKHVVLAHHREDQAETFLLRLARGSGVDGLSCMARETQMHGVTLLRPLLDVSKMQLLAYLKAKKQRYIDDPSNHKLIYDRVRMRKALPMLAELGLTPERLVSTAKAMERTRKSLEAQTAAVLAVHCDYFPEGYAALKPFDADDEIALRVMASLVMTIGGHIVKPRLEETEQLLSAVRQKPFKGATLGGCQFIAHKGAIVVCRELSAVQKPVPATQKTWDKRFAVTCNAPKGWTVGALTQAGWLALAKQHGLKNTLPDKRILYTLPALRDEGGNVRAVPHLGVNDASVTITLQSVIPA